MAVRSQRAVTDYSSPPRSVLGDDRVAALRRHARAVEIEDGNARLLDKITTIMRRPPGSAHGAREYYANRLTPTRFLTTKIDAIDPSQPNGYSPAGTLNASVRKKQLAAIDAENKKLLRRMHHLKPNVDSAALDYDWARRNVRLESLRRGSGPVLPVAIASTQAAWPVEPITMPVSRSMPELPWSPLPPMQLPSTVRRRRAPPPATTHRRAAVPRSHYCPLSQGAPVG